MLSSYAVGDARWDHQAEIRREYGLREWAEPALQAEFLDWLQARAWVGAESHRVLFDRTVDHLIASRCCCRARACCGASWARFASARKTGWTLVAEPLTDSERERLLAVLVATGGGGDTPYERLRHGPVKPTAEGVLDALCRFGLIELGGGLEHLSHRNRSEHPYQPGIAPSARGVGPLRGRGRNSFRSVRAGDVV